MLAQHGQSPTLKTGMQPIHCTLLLSHPIVLLIFTLKIFTSTYTTSSTEKQPSENYMCVCHVRANHFAIILQIVQKN